MSKSFDTLWGCCYKKHCGYKLPQRKQFVK